MNEFYILSLRGFAGIFQRPFYVQDLWEQMEYIGANALFIIVVSATFIGMALSLQLTSAFTELGLGMYAGTPTGVSIISEIGPVLTGVIFAGRTSAGMASELGSMVLGHQVDTLRVFAVDPIKKLVTPRLIASSIMLPCLTIIGDAIALLGGAYISTVIEHGSWHEYWTSINQAFKNQYVAAGLMKPLAFGIIVSLVGSYMGLTTKGGARGLRNSTTWAFVLATVLIILIDLIVTKLLTISPGNAEWLS